MTAAMIRAANRIITDLQVVNGNIVNFTEIGSEGAVLLIKPDPDLYKGLTLLEAHKASVRFYIARNGEIRNHDGTRYNGKVVK
jgi:hypothetical protein